MLKERRTPTDPWDGNSIYEVLPVDIGTDKSREEAEMPSWDNIGESYPSHSDTRFNTALEWDRFYRFFREGIPF